MTDGRISFAEFEVPSLFTYQVAVLDPANSRPQIHVTVEARNATTGLSLGLAETNIYGIATFVLPVNTVTFHARTPNRPPLYQVVTAGNLAERGMGPFMWDYLVDANWAAEVAAGRGTEGQVFTTFHGHTFKVYSTIPAAITDANANRQTANQDSSFFIVAGTYTISSANTLLPPLLGAYHFYGSGQRETIIQAGAGS